MFFSIIHEYFCSIFHALTQINANFVKKKTALRDFIAHGSDQQRHNSFEVLQLFASQKMSHRTTKRRCKRVGTRVTVNIIEGVASAPQLIRIETLASATGSMMFTLKMKPRRNGTMDFGDGTGNLMPFSGIKKV